MDAEAATAAAGALGHLDATARVACALGKPAADGLRVLHVTAVHEPLSPGSSLRSPCASDASGSGATLSPAASAIVDAPVDSAPPAAPPARAPFCPAGVAGAEPEPEPVEDDALIDMGLSDLVTALFAPTRTGAAANAAVAAVAAADAWLGAQVPPDSCKELSRTITALAPPPCRRDPRATALAAAAMGAAAAAGAAEARAGPRGLGWLRGALAAALAGAAGGGVCEADKELSQLMAWHAAAPVLAARG